MRCILNAEEHVSSPRYEGPLFSPSTPWPLLLSQSSYFWPLGMVAPLRNLACSSCSTVARAPLRSALTMFAPLRFALLRLALARMAPVRLAALRSAPLRLASRSLAPALHQKYLLH